MPGKGTTDAIFVVRQMQGKFLSKKRKLYLGFVDLQGATGSGEMVIKESNSLPKSNISSKFLSENPTFSQKSRNFLQKGQYFYAPGFSQVWG